MFLVSPSSLSINRMRASPIKSMAAVNRNSSSGVVTAAPPHRRNNTSPLEARISLVFALASQTTSLSHKLLTELAGETAKYVFPKRIFESRNLEEALMSVPDLETVKFKVLKRCDQYEIREVEPYFVAEVTMPSKYGFDFNGASQSFNTLAEYLFGKNTKKESMAMTTPVITRRTQSEGERMEMTTPVITTKRRAINCIIEINGLVSLPRMLFANGLVSLPLSRVSSRGSIGNSLSTSLEVEAEDQEKWRMSFVMPSKYGSDLPLPKDSSVTIKEVPRKTVAVVAFSGFVNDEDVKARESRLRAALKGDAEFNVKDGALVEVAQYNPPFTLPFTRRNEISLEVERKQE